MDKVLSTMPLELNPLDESHSGAEAMLPERKIALVTQRNGILIVSSCAEVESRAQETLIELFSKLLPHRGCLTPLHGHITPITPFPEKCTVNERTNQNVTDYNLSMYQLYFLSDRIKRHLVTKAGFTKRKLEEFLSSQQGSNF